MSIEIIHGDALEILRALLSESIHCCVTSPPYWGLRDYGVSGQIGLEATPQEYVEKLVLVFREVRRVLRKDGTLWLNMGDCYAGSGRGGHIGEHSTLHGSRSNQQQTRKARASQLRCGFHATVAAAGHIGRAWVAPPDGLKQKNLIGIPWRLAFALQADGWYLRSEIIWHKPNCMPESVMDRPTVAHERIFLISKSLRYFYDADAISEPCASGPSDLRKMMERKPRIDAKHFHADPGKLAKANRSTNIGKKRGVGGLRFAIGRMFKDHDAAHLSRSGNKKRSFEGRLSHVGHGVPWEGLRRNKRSVWSVATEPFKGAHFATFPKKLVEPCILAGCPEGGTVLDPFAGSGTVGQVAHELGRGAILIELNGEYLGLIRERLDQNSKLKKHNSNGPTNKHSMV